MKGQTARDIFASSTSIVKVRMTPPTNDPGAAASAAPAAPKAAPASAEDKARAETHKEVDILYNKLKKGGKDANLSQKEIQKFLTTLYEKFTKYDEKVRALDNAKAEITSLKANMDNMKGEIKNEKKRDQARLVQLEKSAVAANLVFRGVAQTHEEEGKADVIATINDVMKTIGVSDEVNVVDAFRFRKTRYSKEGVPQVVLVKLKDPKQKGLIFQNVHKLKGTNYDRINIANEHPASLRKPIADLEKKAFELRAHARENGKRLQTRIEIVRGEPYIKVRDEGMAHFDFYEENKQDDSNVTKHRGRSSSAGRGRGSRSVGSLQQKSGPQIRLSERL